ncbi:MAG: PAS domain S-box protein, partial [Desulfobacteraceae bacterium]|nr:PAS domain S-box protein [Desulfobacteraceae bacterium]
IYFHRVLGSATVFTHLFYIPIILASLWWGRVGIGVAAGLVGLLLTSHWMHLTDNVPIDDYFRAIMFVVIAVTVVLLRDKLLATDIALKKQTIELEQRVRALSCLYGINDLRDQQDLTLEDIFAETEKLLKTALEHDSALRISIHRQDDDGQAQPVSPNASHLIAPIRVEAQPVGGIEIQWFGPREPDAGLLDHARQLADAVARRLGKIIEHENARAELERYRLHLEDVVQDRTEELIEVNRRLRNEIDERQKAEISLRESELQYRVLFENAKESIFIAQNDQICFPNPAVAALTGHPIERLLKSSFLDLVHPEDRSMVRERYVQRLAGEDVPHAYTFRIVAANGAIRWVEINAVVIPWQGQPATLNFLRDITDRKKMEAEVSQIEKMEAIGVLAGGIAHQFNNALSGITGNLDLLKFAVPDNPNVKRYSTAMHQAVRTMSGLTQQLLAYARGGRYQSQKYSLTVMVKDVLAQMGSTGDKHIRFETAFAADTPMVEADPVQMRMVMLAIFHNAAEAIDKEGRIRIETFRARLTPSEAEAFIGLPPGEYASLSITDNGKGMAEEIRNRVFEPFFSTKFPGRGLGMAAAYGIVKNHGGYIYIDSEPGRGTVVNILLPPCPAPEKNKKPEN